MVKPSITYGRTNIYDRINDYNKSFDNWNKIIDKIPYKVYVFENSGYGNPFNLDPRITYISENVQHHEVHEKGKSHSMVIVRFIELLQLKKDDKVLVMTGRYSPTDSLDELFDVIEKNDIVITELPGLFGPINTEWFAMTVERLLEVCNTCILSCAEVSKNFEHSMFLVINNYDVKRYKAINVIPVQMGGEYRQREFI